MFYVDMNEMNYIKEGLSNLVKIQDDDTIFK